MTLQDANSQNELGRRAPSLRQPRALLAVFVVLFAASGASCPQFLQVYKYTGAKERVLPESATLADVIQTVNGNTALVQSLAATDATINLPKLPDLRANIALERPHRFRLKAETALTGGEVDLGSNDDLFWFWVRRNQPPAVYLCRHDRYQASPARRVLPVEPEWLIDALGLTTLDPNGQHRGPAPLGNGRLEIRTTLPGPEGELTKITVVDEVRGWVLEQHLYDARGDRVATALARQHWRDPGSGAILPKQVEIEWPAAQFALTINLRTVQVNRLPSDQQQLFSLPQYPNAGYIDLGDPRFQPPTPTEPAPPEIQAARPPYARLR